MRMVSHSPRRVGEPREALMERLLASLRQWSLHPDLLRGSYTLANQNEPGFPQEGDGSQASPSSNYGEEKGTCSCARAFSLAYAAEIHLFMTLVIAFNIVTCIIEAALIQDELARLTVARMEVCFTLVFAAELVLRLASEGIKMLMYSEDVGWNWFDVVVTVCGVIDICQPNKGAHLFRVFRMVRRMMRVFQMAQYSEDIKAAMLTAVKATIKFGVLVVLIVVMAAVAATNLLWDCDDEDVRVMYSHLGVAMWSVFKLMTMDNWIGHVNQVLDVYPGMWVFFACFIFLAGMSLMSLVPSVFIELHMRDQVIEEKLLQEEAEKPFKQALELTMQRLFLATDADASGQVSCGEMKDSLHNGTMDRIERELIDAAVLNEEDAHMLKLGLFELWEDVVLFDKPDAELDEKDFIVGILRARSSSMKQLWQTTASTRMQLRQLSDSLDYRLEQILSLLGQEPESVPCPGSPQQRRRACRAPQQQNTQMQNPANTDAREAGQRVSPRPGRQQPLQRSSSAAVARNMQQKDAPGYSSERPARELQRAYAAPAPSFAQLKAVSSQDTTQCTTPIAGGSSAQLLQHDARFAPTQPRALPDEAGSHEDQVGMPSFPTATPNMEGDGLSMGLHPVRMRPF